MKKYIKIAGMLTVVSFVILSGCTNNTINMASKNSKMLGNNVSQSQETQNETQSQNDAQTTDQPESTKNNKEVETVHAEAIKKDTSIYDVNIAEDRASYNGKVDITVGDHFYSTQINDWYMNFQEYAGKVVEIEGYYIDEFSPYLFVGRYGPQCPYCQGGYVSFEILTDREYPELKNAKDWIKVTGILREGNDQLMGKFCYIEVLDLQKMDKVGQDTVVN